MLNNDVNKNTVIQTVTASLALIGATVIMIFQSRIKAGEKLAQALQAFGLADPIVLALPHGGVPVGAAIAKALTCRRMLKLSKLNYLVTK